MKTNEPDAPNVLDRIQRLQKIRQEVLSLPVETAMDKILTTPQPAALVHSFKEEDLYLLLQDIGPEDALPLLMLASDKQWEYILDLEVWEKDRLSSAALTHWLGLLFKADQTRMLKWCLAHKQDLLTYYLFKNLEVRIRETDQMPSDFGPDFFTEDDTFYVRIREPSPDQVTGQTAREQRHAFLSEFIRHLSRYDHVVFQNLLIESAAILPAETEEEAYRLRNVRLAEKGFLPFDEAVGVYQPLKITEFEAGPPKHLADLKDAAMQAPGPLYPARLLPSDNRFTDALQLIDMETVLPQIQSEFAGLCNQVIAADRRKVTGKDDLGQVVRKVCAFVNLGLTRLSQAKDLNDVGHWATLIKRFPLIRFFRLGYGMVLELKWQAEKWHKRSWFTTQGLPLSFWDEKWMGVLGGVLLKKPLYFDDYRTGQLYRDFATLEEIQATEQALAQMMAFDSLLDLMALKPGPLANHQFINYKNLLLTHWARHYLGLSTAPAALSVEELKRFFNTLFIPVDTHARPLLRKLNPAMRSVFLAWLADRSGLADYEISEKVGTALEGLFLELENEYGPVAPKTSTPAISFIFSSRNKAIGRPIIAIVRNMFRLR